MAAILAFFTANKAAILGISIAVISEVMALVPSWKSSGIVDFVLKALKSADGQ